MENEGAILKYRNTEDKDSLRYFMTQMTQEEFSERMKDVEIKSIKLNRIKCRDQPVIWFNKRDHIQDKLS